MEEVFDEWVVGLRGGVVITVKGNLDYDTSNGLVFKQGAYICAVIAEYAYALRKEK